MRGVSGSLASEPASGWHESSWKRDLNSSKSGGASSSALLLIPASCTPSCLSVLFLKYVPPSLFNAILMQFYFPKVNKKPIGKGR
jgi:hypothetical protein